MLRVRNLMLLAAVSFGLMVLATNDRAYAFKCEAQVMEALSTVNMGKSDMNAVKVAKYPNPVGGGNQSTNYKYDAWIKLNSCSNGHAVVHLSRGCVVQHMFTTGSCEMPGMKNY